MRNLMMSLVTLLVMSFAANVLIASDSISPEDMSVLSAQDLDRYENIFALQEDGKWQQADRQIKALDDRLLMGHVLFQRYMHPTKYRSKYSELKAWMANYADHPEARRIYNLARKRQGNAATPKRPVRTRYPGVTGHSGPPTPAAPNRTRSQARALSSFNRSINRNLKRGSASRAERQYWAMSKRGLLSDYESAKVLERVAAYYFSDGDDFKAHALADLGADFNGQNTPRNHWIAGISAWRMGDVKLSVGHFSQLANIDGADPWLRSAGGFWASRALNRLNDPEEARKYLKIASDQSETFYGLIAARQLGIEVSFDWSMPSYSSNVHKRLSKYPAARRAIALSQINLSALADEELRLLWGREGATVQNEVVALASALALPAIQLRIGRTGAGGRDMPVAVRYPLPDWTPEGGFSYDRAMLYAFVRQESSFRARARSSVGGHGLMQVMPATASYLTKDRSLYRRDRQKLLRPEFNMALGQQYITYLLGQDFMPGDLFTLLAAYNAGPGSYSRWQGALNYHKDPLLFIEAIPYWETRDHIELVMLNLWLYRMRLGQDTPSLDAVAAGTWPVLAIIDDDTTERASKAWFRAGQTSEGLISR